MKETTHDSGVDAERYEFLALSTFSSDSVGEERHAAAFGAHEHVALAVQYEIELGDEHADVAHEALFRICTRKLVDIC